MKIKCAFLFILVAATGATLASDYNRIEGSYAITSSSLMDLAPGEKKDRLVLFIEGKAARETYDQMHVPVKISACDPDLRAKSAGSLTCSKDINRDEYQCSIGVILNSGISVKAVVC